MSLWNRRARPPTTCAIHIQIVLNVRTGHEGPVRRRLTCRVFGRRVVGRRVVVVRARGLADGVFFFVAGWCPGRRGRPVPPERAVPFGERLCVRAEDVVRVAMLARLREQRCVAVDRHACPCRHTIHTPRVVITPRAGESRGTRWPMPQTTS